MFEIVKGKSRSNFLMIAASAKILGKVKVRFKWNTRWSFKYMTFLKNKKTMIAEKRRKLLYVGFWLVIVGILSSLVYVEVIKDIFFVEKSDEEIIKAWFLHKNVEKEMEEVAINMLKAKRMEIESSFDEVTRATLADKAETYKRKIENRNENWTILLLGSCAAGIVYVLLFLPK